MHCTVWLGSTSLRTKRRVPSFQRTRAVGVLLADLAASLSQRVQSTQIWGIYGFYTRNRNSDTRNVFCIWVLGPSGFGFGYTCLGLKSFLFRQNQSRGWPKSSFYLQPFSRLLEGRGMSIWCIYCIEYWDCAIEYSNFTVRVLNFEEPDCCPRGTRLLGPCS